MADENAPANERPDGQDRLGLIDRLRRRFSPQEPVQRIDVVTEMNEVMRRALEPNAEQARQFAADIKAAGEERLAYLFADDVHPGRDRSTLSNQEFLEVLRTAEERQKGVDQAMISALADSPASGSPELQGAGTDAMRHATLGVSEAKGAATRDAGTAATPAAQSPSKPAAKTHEL
jgi:uncharacterized protein (DUF2267 family)